MGRDDAHGLQTVPTALSLHADDAAGYGYDGDDAYGGGGHSGGAYAHNYDRRVAHASYGDGGGLYGGGGVEEVDVAADGVDDALEALQGDDGADFETMRDVDGDGGYGDGDYEYDDERYGDGDNAEDGDDDDSESGSVAAARLHLGIGGQREEVAAAQVAGWGGHGPYQNCGSSPFAISSLSRRPLCGTSADLAGADRAGAPEIFSEDGDDAASIMSSIRSSSAPSSRGADSLLPDASYGAEPSHLPEGSADQPRPTGQPLAHTEGGIGPTSTPGRVRSHFGGGGHGGGRSGRHNTSLDADFDPDSSGSVGTPGRQVHAHIQRPVPMARANPPSPWPVPTLHPHAPMHARIHRTCMPTHPCPHMHTLRIHPRTCMPIRTCARPAVRVHRG